MRIPLSLASGILCFPLPASARPPIICDSFNISQANCNCRFLAELCEHIQVRNGFALFYAISDDKLRLKQLLYARFSAFAAFLSVVGNTIVVIIAVNQRSDRSNFKQSGALLACCDLIFSTLDLIYVLPRF